MQSELWNLSCGKYSSVGSFVCRKRVGSSLPRTSGLGKKQLFFVVVFLVLRNITLLETVYLN